MKHKITVITVDDHDLVRRGLKVSLETFDDIEHLAEAEDGRTAILLCQQYQPDVMLLDLILSDSINGLTVIERVKKVSPHTAIVALTNFKDDELVNGAIKAGAIGYLLKNVLIDDLAQAIRAAYRGDPILSPEAARVLMQRDKTQMDYQLTPRELEILQYLVAGDTNPEIAERLTISRSTVKNHVSKILTKLNAGSRTEAVSLALRTGLVENDDLRQP
ncbi:response regulator transcription factor [Phototrophicus methaneseepsis]|uniref:Response regulator transcription factor n=1 Tax=Phototrophicus methaneseepsis TaxID=2710758 RepID=A0A7S8IEU8_9CHLR|nr:response regulator transcription factor [Phototrophicus methaneseepsis]QPC84060.1 response regulator transcription factor [Phototrophicus methaneseepsis]